MKTLNELAQMKNDAREFLRNYSEKQKEFEAAAKECFEHYDPLIKAEVAAKYPGYEMSVWHDTLDNDVPCQFFVEFGEYRLDENGQWWKWGDIELEKVDDCPINPAELEKELAEKFGMPIFVYREYDDYFLSDEELAENEAEYEKYVPEDEYPPGVPSHKDIMDALKG
jgi:hypothetical protein